MRTESQDAISFTTERDLTIDIASLREVLVTRDASNYFDARMAVQRGRTWRSSPTHRRKGTRCTSATPKRWRAVTLALRFECRPGGRRRRPA